MRIRSSTAAALLGALLVPVAVGAQASGPIDLAIRAEAARVAAGAVGSTSIPATQQQAGLSAWASVAALNAGSEILLVHSGAAPARYRLLSVQDDSLTILDASSPAIPTAVARRLRNEASRQPGTFREARNGRDVELTKQLSVGPAGVTDRGQLLFPLTLVVVDISRADVIELSVIRKHIGRHARRGMIIGAIVGGVVGGGGAASCSGCGNPAGFMALGAGVGAVAGAQYGFIIGLLVPRGPDLVYRR